MRGGKVSGPERDVRRILREIADMIEAEGRGMKFRKKKKKRATDDSAFSVFIRPAGQTMSIETAKRVKV